MYDLFALARLCLGNSSRLIFILVICEKQYQIAWMMLQLLVYITATLSVIFIEEITILYLEFPWSFHIPQSSHLYILRCSHVNIKTS